MSLISQEIQNLIIDLRVAALRPLVEYAVRNIDSFDNKPDIDKLCIRVAEDLKIDLAATNSSSSRGGGSTRGGGGKVSDAVKGLSASKSAPAKSGGGGGKKGSKKDESEWMNLETYLANRDRADEPLCAYSPPRGQNKGMFCGAIANEINDTNSNDSAKYRCSSCRGKTGRGEKIINGDGDAAPSRSIRGKNAPGFTRHTESRPTSRKSGNEGKREEKSGGGKDEEELTLKENDDLAKILGEGFYLFELDKLGMFLATVNEDDSGVQTVKVFGKFNKLVDETSRITPKMLVELTPPKLSAELITRKNLVIGHPDELDYDEDGEDAKEADEENEAPVPSRSAATRNVTSRTSRPSVPVEDEEPSSRGGDRGESRSSRAPMPSRGESRRSAPEEAPARSSTRGAPSRGEATSRGEAPSREPSGREAPSREGATSGRGERGREDKAPEESPATSSRNRTPSTGRSAPVARSGRNTTPESETNKKEDSPSASARKQEAPADQEVEQEASQEAPLV
jgi:hypothetical protein